MNWNLDESGKISLPRMDGHGDGSFQWTPSSKSKDTFNIFHYSPPNLPTPEKWKHQSADSLRTSHTHQSFTQTRSPQFSSPQHAPVTTNNHHSSNEMEDLVLDDSLDEQIDSFLDALAPDLGVIYHVRQN